jgi:hypothetical protein
MPPPPATDLSLEQDLDLAIDTLRGLLTDSLGRIAVEPTPQGLIRGLGLDKSLAWKLSKVLHAEGAVEAFNHLPGVAGLRLVANGLTAAGAPPEGVRKLREVAGELKHVIARHGGDRAGFETLLTSLSAERDAARRSEDCRKQAYRANGAIWGVQARLRLGLHVIAPNHDDPSFLDFVTCGGLYDLRRLRPSARWPIVHRQDYSSPDGQIRDQPIDPACGPDDPPIIEAFCSSPTPALATRRVNNGTLYELQSGPLGKTGAMTCVFGFLSPRHSPIAGTIDDDIGRYLTQLNTPVEHVLVDLLIHDDLSYTSPPEPPVIASRMETSADLMDDPDARYTLPVNEPLREFRATRSRLATPLVPRHPELVEFVTDRLGRKVEDFRVFRFVMRYPPIPAAVLLRHKLGPGE